MLANKKNWKECHEENKTKMRSNYSREQRNRKTAWITYTGKQIRNKINVIGLIEINNWFH